MNGLQRLPRNEETALLDLVRENDLPVSKLRCEYTRQTDSGVGRSKRHGWEYGISYDLMLCKYCGNLEGSRNNTPYCPHKLETLRVRLLMDKFLSDDIESPLEEQLKHEREP